MTFARGEKSGGTGNVPVVIERNDEECVWKKLRAATGSPNRLIPIVTKSRLNWKECLRE
jgi:hypothetical protein